MGIIDDRLSTEPVPDTYLDPDGRDHAFNEDWEAGPIAVTDTSQGLYYQAWKLTFVSGDFIITPETTGLPVIVLSGQNSEQCSFAFDQNGRPAIGWIDSLGVAYLYWYDSTVSTFVITNLGPLISLMLSLDDKRVMQSGASDILLWYVLDVGGGTYNLYSKKQRDRFETQYSMATGCYPQLVKAGMHQGLRGQITASTIGSPVVPPTLPSGPPAPQGNLDFEFGDVYWEKGTNFAINQLDSYAGLWSAFLNANPAVLSTLENSVYTAVTPNNMVTITCRVKGSIATSVSFGIRFYSGSKALLETSTTVKVVTTIWETLSQVITVPFSAVYARIYIESNNTDGLVSFDDFTFTEV